MNIESGAKIDRKCQLESCGIIFPVRVYEVKRGKGKFCSQSCSAQALSLASQARVRKPKKQSSSNQSPLYSAHLPRELEQAWPVEKMYKILIQPVMGRAA